MRGLHDYFTNWSGMFAVPISNFASLLREWPVRVLSRYVNCIAARLYGRTAGMAGLAAEALTSDIAQVPAGARAYAIEREPKDEHSKGTTYVVRRIHASGISLLSEQPLLARAEYSVRIADTGCVRVARVESCEPGGSGRFFFDVRMSWVRIAHGTDCTAGVASPPPQQPIRGVTQSSSDVRAFHRHLCKGISTPPVRLARESSRASEFGRRREKVMHIRRDRTSQRTE